MMIICGGGGTETVHSDRTESGTGASSTSIKLTWTEVTGATGYKIYRSKYPTSGFTSIATSTSTGYTNTELTTGTKYYYQVKAYTTVGTTKSYSVVTSAVSATP